MKLFSAPEPIFSRITEHICKGPIPTEWSQPFIFKPHSYSLYQNENGPCGLMASLQAYICLSLKETPDSMPDQLLMNAILDIMYKIRRCFVICTKIDKENKSVEWYASQDREVAVDFLIKSKWVSAENASLLFMFSIVILLGPVWLNSFAFSDPFIMNGQTSLNFVLLLLTGEALDSYHDGNILTNGIVFKGALKEQKVGFVSISETDEFQGVGKKFSNPTHGVWLGYYGGHFTTLVKNKDILVEFDALHHSSLFNVVDKEHIFYSKLVH